MKIEKLKSYFHDGTVIDINQFDNTVEFSLKSAEILPTDRLFEIPLSYDSTIRGKLWLEKINKILINNEPTQKLEMLYDSAEILELKVSEKEISILLKWEKLRPKFEDRGFSSISVAAEKIYWENIPNLLDPFEFTEPSLDEYLPSSHYHHLNPNTTGKHNKYFDQEGNIVAQGSPKSYLKPKKFEIETSLQLNNKKATSLALSKYAIEFHDGDLLFLEQKKQNIIARLSSREIRPELMKDDIPLSIDNRIKGTLYLNGVSKVIKNKKKFYEPITMHSKCATIHYIQFEQTKVILSILWERYKPVFKELKNDVFEIEANTIFWEANPSLSNPCW